MAGLNQLKRNISDLVNDPRGYLEMVADRMNNSVMGRRAIANDRGAGMIKMTPAERQEQIQQALIDSQGSGAMGGALGIIKQKGGNWLGGSVENMLSRLKTNAHMFPDARPSELALDKWIEGPLTRYVKRDMATEGDPVRKLAEQGITHVAPEQLYYNAREVHPSGEALQKLGKSQAARAWENASDYAVASSPAETYQNFGSSNLGLDWVNKLDPNIPFYRPYGQLPNNDLGFSHLTDELRNALNPESGLPRHLQLTQDQMSQLGMEKAVRHVAAINEWRAAQKAKANAELSQSPAVKLVREYAENNPKGLRWVELRQPEGLPDGFDSARYLVQDGPHGGRGVFDTVQNKWFVPPTTSKMTDEELMKHALDNATKDQRRQILQDQLKYEGDTMGHCVGGYCDEVARGQSRIFSLRDAKGEPHVTIETQPNLRGLREYLNKFEHPERPGRLEPDALGITDTLHDYVQANRRGNGDYDEFGLETLKRLGYPLPPDSIVQVKGKANLKPKAEYIPFVQDFIRNHPEGGQWGDIGDLHHTDLIKTEKHGLLPFNDIKSRIRFALDPELPETMGRSDLVPVDEYLKTYPKIKPEDIDNFIRGSLNQSGYGKHWDIMDEVPGMAEGGLVKENWEPIEADGILGYILR